VFFDPPRQGVCSGASNKRQGEWGGGRAAALAWEAAFVQLAQGKLSHMAQQAGLRLSFSAQRSVQDEVARESAADLPTVRSRSRGPPSPAPMLARFHPPCLLFAHPPCLLFVHPPWEMLFIRLVHCASIRLVKCCSSALFVVFIRLACQCKLFVHWLLFVVLCCFGGVGEAGGVRGWGEQSNHCVWCEREGGDARWRSPTW
jgi:hypothetical protein